MESLSTSPLRIGAWRVDPSSGSITRNGETIRLDVRAMRLLLCLAGRPGQVVSIDDLISNVWGGVAVSPDSVYQALTSLRRQLGDDSRQPAYIETVPRLGYRMIAPVGPWQESSPQPAATQAAPAETKTNAGSSKPSSRRVVGIVWAAVALAVAVALGFVLHARFASDNRPAALASAAPPQASVGVLPFLDLTTGMHNEEFADGMTEELIDKLSKVQGLSVPSATSSFYYKGKQLPVAEMARALNVAYVLDGSVRKSSGRVRIAARLVRAENSYVVWTETYERPFDDLIMMQDDIAGEVAKALKSSIVATPQPGKSQ
jgi:TolB-like protein/DNA-binding winged helix-turn-helix (wHTH) protein